MGNQILCIIFMTLPNTLQAMAFEEMLEANPEKGKKWMRILCWTILTGASITYKVLLNDQNKANTFKWIFMMAAQIFPIFYFYKDAVWRKFLAIIAMMLGISCAEIGLLFVIKYIKIESMLLWDYRSPEIMFSTMIGTIFSFFGIILISVVWRFFFRKGKVMRQLWFFLLYAVFQLSTFDTLKYALVNGAYNYSVIYTSILSLICDVALIIVVFNQSEQETIKVKYTENRRQATLEQMHYEEAKQHQQTLVKVMKANNQTIEQVEKFLADDQKEDAEQLLTELLHKIAETKENQYCTIPIVNAILTEKQRECEQYRIHLKTDIRIPEDIVIKQMDLCSIFSNLLDNAIRASKKVTLELQQESDVSESVVIQLTAVVKGNYLIIKCDNPTVEEPGIKPEGSGYGQKILWDIAKRYQGDFRTKYEENHYHAQLSISVC